MNFVLEILRDYPWWSFLFLTIWGFVAWIPVWPEGGDPYEPLNPVVCAFLALLLLGFFGSLLWNMGSYERPTMYIDHVLFVANIVLTMTLIQYLWSAKKIALYEQHPELEIAEEILGCRAYPRLKRDEVAREAPLIRALLKEISRLEKSVSKREEAKKRARELYQKASAKADSSVEISSDYSALARRCAEELGKRVVLLKKDQKALAEKKAELSASKNRLGKALRLFQEARAHEELTIEIDKEFK